MSEVDILRCLIQPLSSGMLELVCLGSMTRSLSWPLGLDMEDEVAESTDEVREGLEER